MTIQAGYILIFLVLLATQAFCGIKALIAKRTISKWVFYLNLAVSLPIIANIIITASSNRLVSIVGYYMYYIGMVFVMLAMVNFTNAYCTGVDPNKKYKKPIAMYIMALLDLISLSIGPVSHHVFEVEQTLVENKIYFISNPLIGLTIHRIICYGMYLCVIAIFGLAVKKTAKIYREKYIFIFIALIAAGILQAYFIITKTPIDRSVIPHGIIGILVYYFAIRYKPVRLLDSLLTSVATNLTDGIIVFDVNYKTLWANSTAFQMLDLRGDVNQIKPALMEIFGDHTNDGDDWIQNFYIEDQDKYYTMEKKTVVNKGSVDGCFLIISDNTKQKKDMEKELYDSNHDRLTGIYNITYLYKTIKEIINKHPEEEYTVVYLNVKNFKIINDIFGNLFGDKALIKIASMLKTSLTDENVIIARLVGDTFGIFMPTKCYNEKIYYKLFSDFKIKANKNTQHQVCVHIGVYENVDKKLDPSVMFDRAHIALNTITDNYKTSLKKYDETIRQTLLEEQKLALNLGTALEENQIRPYLQPITDVFGKVVGAEALARWIHPELGFLPPGKFIPTFEKNGMIVEVDRHIWEEVCKILQNWKDKYPDLFLSINISPKDFYFLDVVQVVCDLVEEYEIESKKLRIEITETAMMSDQEEKLKIFNTLREKGFIVEMDDFGSGYSSLNMLKNMPVDVLKIDMNFLDENGNDRSKTIVKNVINLSNELKLTTLTEGVENLQQYSDLIDMGCVLFQGYYFAKPMPVDEFEKFLEERK